MRQRQAPEGPAEGLHLSNPPCHCDDGGRSRAKTRTQVVYLLEKLGGKFWDFF